jgi:hypothetical protein
MTSTDTILELYKTTDDGLVHSSEWYRLLSEAVNDLVLHDFNGLIQILYRLDVSEEKIRRALLQNTGIDAAVLITNLLLERQLQRLATRKEFSQTPPANDEERW